MFHRCPAEPFVDINSDGTSAEYVNGTLTDERLARMGSAGTMYFLGEPSGQHRLDYRQYGQHRRAKSTIRSEMVPN